MGKSTLSKLLLTLFLSILFQSYGQNCHPDSVYYSRISNKIKKTYSKEYFSFDSQENLLQDLIVSYNYSTNVWDSQSRFLFLYDTTNTLIQETHCMWLPTLHKWQAEEIIDYSRDSTGLQISSLAKDWNDYYQTWENSEKKTSQYNLQGRILKIQVQNWNNTLNNWENPARQTFIYNSFDSVIKNLTQYLDTSGVWIDSKQDTFTFNGNNMPISKVSQFWRPNLNAWVNDEKREFIYESNGTSFSEFLYYWDNNNWQKNLKVQNIKNQYNSISNDSIFKWNSTSLDWDFDDKSEFSYYNNNCLKLILNFSNSTNCNIDSFLSIQEIAYFYPFSNTDILAISSNTSINLYPNPSSQSVTLSNFKLNVPIEISNHLGQKIDVFQSGNSTTKLNIENYPSGIYYVKQGSEVSRFLKD